MDNEFHEALTSLEVLMSEFFAPTTSNIRKREIEGMLENFSNRRDSWKHCLLFLQKSQNQYVLMFTLTTLENIINKQWISLSDHEKIDIRQTLWNELLAKHEVMIYFIRNKLAALMVSIARYDWPHNYPDFFDNIIELIQCDGRRCLLGLVLAQAASEELGAARDTGILLPTDRRTQLERLMLKGTPQLLNALSAILEKNAQKGSQSNPPPSPTSGIPQTSALPDLLANAKVADKALDMEIVVKCLTTLQHLFSWLPLSSHVPPSLVSTVFYWGSVATQTQSLEAGLAGLGGVCELLYRRYSPPASAATALRLHHAATQLLRHAPHHHAPQQYLDKFAEFLKLFVSLHFKRLEAEAEFDAMEFLSYLFQYTFQVPTCATFVNCLDIWIQFMDILKPEDTAKYWEALRGLVNGVLNKIQFQHNKAQLQQLDNDICDDDGETEWQSFLRHCIECIARVAEMVPLEVFEIVLERWRCLQDVHARASSRSTTTSGADGERLLAALVDLATLTRVLGRLAPHAVTDAAGRAAGLSVIDRGAGILNNVIISRPYRQPTANAAAHTHLEAEVVACMGLWARYAAECGAAPRTLLALLAAAAAFLRAPPHHPPEPPLLCHAAAHLLLSLAKNVKFAEDPLKLLEELYSQAQRSLHYLEPKTAAVVREALLTLALSAGAGGAGGGGAGGGGAGGGGAGGGGGGACARALVSAWCGALGGAGPGAALPPLTSALLAFQHAPTRTKQILAESVLGTAQTALRMLCEPSYALAEPEITDFFLALFTTVLQQMGDFTYNAIDCFLEVAQRGGSECGASRLVECVRLGVETEARRVRVGLVLGLCAPPLTRAVAKLLASVLIYRWRYFFPTKLLEEGEEARRMDELRTALSTLGQSLLDGDIEVFRIAIETLDILNTKWRLYHRAIFRTEFLAEFLSVLLISVSERGGGRALYREEVLSAIHAMAAVDFVAFRTAFLPHFLGSMQGLTQEQVQHLAQFAADTDLPTFTQNVQRLMNDVNCYRAYSSLLPNQMPT